MKKHIVFAITRSDTISSGAFVHVRDMAQALLSKKYCNVTVLIGGNGPATKVLEALNIPHVCLENLSNPISVTKDFYALQELIRVLKFLQPDLVSLHTTKIGWLGRIACTFLGFNSIYTPHGLSFADGVQSGRKKLYLNLERVLRPLGVPIIGVCQYDSDMIIRKHVAASSNVLTIPNGIIPVKPKKHLESQHKNVKLLMVGRFETQKHHKLLISSLSNIKDLPWTLDVFGDGPLANDIKNFSDSLWCSNRINYKGVTKNISDEYRNYDIFCLASRWEGLPRSILEAMSCGLAVIASDVGGISECVKSNETGYTLPNNEESWTKSLRSLILNGTLRRSFGDAGKELFDKKFEFSIMLSAYLELYDTLLSNTTNLNSEINLHD